MKLEFGIHIPIHGAYDFANFLETAMLAEKLGYSIVTVGDHFFLPAESYQRTGGNPNRPDKLDAWVALAALAANTKKIKLGTRVSPLPFYLPSRLAKVVATVDVLSGGRVQLGVGAGWYKEEALAYGIEWKSFKERIDRMLEALNIIVKLWTEEAPTYKGKYYSILKAPFWPKPIQKPHPPIWFGGSSNVIIDATARYGDGLLPTTNMSLDKLQGLYSRVRNAEKKYDRKNHVTFASSLSLPDGLGKTFSEWTENVEAQIKAGANLVQIDLSNSPMLPAKAQRFLRKFANKVLPGFTSKIEKDAR